MDFIQKINYKVDRYIDRKLIYRSKNFGIFGEYDFLHLIPELEGNPLKVNMRIVYNDDHTKYFTKWSFDHYYNLLKKIKKEKIRIVVIGYGSLNSNLFYVLECLCKHFRIKNLFKEVIIYDGDVINYIDLVKSPVWTLDSFYKADQALAFHKIIGKKISVVKKFITLDEIKKYRDEGHLIYGCPEGELKREVDLLGSYFMDGYLFTGNYSYMRSRNAGVPVQERYGKFNSYLMLNGIIISVYAFLYALIHNQNIGYEIENSGTCLFQIDWRNF